MRLTHRDARRLMASVSVLAAVMLPLGLPGCKQFGPGALREGRMGYNAAIQQTADQELLLNIVRLRYRDTPSVLQIANIATQMSLQKGIDGRLNFLPSTADSYNVFADITYYERPTISYRPVVGQAFITQMLEPVSEAHIMLLYNAGWPVDTLFGLTLQSINGIENAPGAAGPTPEVTPQFNKFQRLNKDLRELQRTGRLSLGIGEDKKLTKAKIDAGGKQAEIAQRVLKALKLTPKQTLFNLGQATSESDDASIAVVTRSLMSTMFYLSQGVDVPEADRDQGRVAVTLKADGQPLDWNKETDGLFRVRVEKHRPDEAYVSIQHRGRWFYIEDNDLQSKTTFSLLSQLFAMQAGSLRNAGPLLTLPVGGG